MCKAINRMLIAAIRDLRPGFDLKYLCADNSECCHLEISVNLLQFIFYKDAKEQSSKLWTFFPHNNCNASRHTSPSNNRMEFHGLFSSWTAQIHKTIQPAMQRHIGSYYTIKEPRYSMTQRYKQYCALQVKWGLYLFHSGEIGILQQHSGYWAASV